MALKFHPEPGTILICSFEPGFREPEMVKTRPVVVVSPRLKNRYGLATVVPLSTSPPERVLEYHCEIAIEPALPAPFDSPTMWVKADMIYTVGFERLNLHRTERDQYGKRKYLTVNLKPEELAKVRRCMLAGLGMLSLTKHIP